MDVPSRLSRTPRMEQGKMALHHLACIAARDDPTQFDIVIMPHWQWHLAKRHRHQHTEPNCT